MWVTNQRRALDSPSHRRVRLESLPGWSWDPRGDRWESRAESLRQFIAERGRTPRVRTEDVDERALAHWYSRQRVALTEGRISDERARVLAYVTRQIAA